MAKKAVLGVIVATIFTGCAAAAQSPGGEVHGSAPRGVPRNSGGDADGLPLYQFIPAAAPSELTPGRSSNDSYHKWARSNADAANTRYSALSQISRENVAQLQVAWEYRSGDGVGNVQANPVIVDDVMYGPTAGGNVVAINAETGREIWRISPLNFTGKPGARGFGPATRGLTYWIGSSRQASRLFFVCNGYLFAVDPQTGDLIRSFGDGGKVAATKGAGTSRFLGAVAPAIFEEIVVAPNQNVVDAFDVISGKRLWSFNTLQYAVTDPKADNGGNVWGGIAMDTTRGIVFVTTGDPRPNFVGVKRQGENPHTNSVIALDVRTGQMLWSFQDIAHNLWDLDLPAAPNLVTVSRDGKLVDAVAQVTKQGNTLLLDRLSGKPLFPFRLRRAPRSSLPGEFTALYQPDLELPEPFARQQFGLGEVTRITPAAHAAVMRKIQGANFGWFETFHEDRPTVIFPGTWGGAEWSGAAFDPVRRVLYVSANELPTITTISRKRVDGAYAARSSSPGARTFLSRCSGCHGEQGEGKGAAPELDGILARLGPRQVKDVLRNGKGGMPPVTLSDHETTELLAFLFAQPPASNTAPGSFISDGFEKLRDDRGYPGVHPPWGTLTAIDLSTGRRMWQVPLGEHEELTNEGIAKTGTLNYGGATVTAGGLVFVAGTMDNRIRAFDAQSGVELWSFQLPFGGFAPPSIYEVKGRQFVVIAATGGGKLGGVAGDAYIAFALPKSNRHAAASSQSSAAGVEKQRDSRGTAGNVTPERVQNARNEPGEWFTGGRDWQQSYFSPLDEINKENVARLGAAWSSPINSSSRFESTPIVVDGTMFTSATGGAVYAIDARNGAALWSFKPSLDLDVMRQVCCGPVNRGVAVWRGKVYVGSLDGYLYALSATTGAVLWKVDTINDRSRAYAITGAPYIAKEYVVIGNSGADLDARGYITAYDAETGRQIWRFFTVPGDPTKSFEHPELQAAAKTWDPNSRWDVGLGGTAWDGMAYDQKLNLLYVGTGNGIPSPRKLRSPAGGDNLFLASILALDAESGRLVWYYQTVPRENWDYTAVQKVILAEVMIKGRLRSVIMQAPKNGFFYVLDRKTGELLSAEPYVRVNWAKQVDKKTGRPIESAQGDYSAGPKLIFPSTHGGHNWQPMAFNPQTGWVYIPAIELPEIFGMPAMPFTYLRQQSNRGVIHFPPGLRERTASVKPIIGHWPALETILAGQPDTTPRTFLRAWDPRRQRLVWEVETTDDSGSIFNLDGSGVMTTAGGLVFQGRNRGNDAGWLVAYSADTGVELHRIDVSSNIHSAPMSYSVDGRQYIAVMAGGRNNGHVLAFALNGRADLPGKTAPGYADKDSTVPPVAPFGTPQEVALGGQLFERICATCHADTSRAPDLTRMSLKVHDEFAEIVLNGVRAERGMGSFRGILTEDEVKAIHAYITKSAWDARRGM